MIKGAIIRDKYRYQLWRIWDEKLPCVGFIMLNPSVADSKQDDPTIRRCINYAKSWGYGGIYVGNLYAYISTDPKQLKKVNDPVGKLNAAHIMSVIGKSELVICAWGNNEKPPEYFKSLLKLHYLELSIKGIPKHPLYLKKDLKPKPYTP